jgi:hypothetical protein
MEASFEVKFSQWKWYLLKNVTGYSGLSNIRNKDIQQEFNIYSVLEK